MKRAAQSRVALSLVAAFGFALWASTTSAVESNSLRREQESQKQARRMARQLVALVLEEQLEPLRQNGLTELPIYREIEQMRENIDDLVDEEMTQVVELLGRAQTAPADERTEIYGEARVAIRTVLFRISAEQQRLLKRLRMARMAADVRGLIKLQKDTLAATEALADRSLEDRETKTGSLTNP